MRWREGSSAVLKLADIGGLLALRRAGSQGTSGQRTERAADDDGSLAGVMEDS